jgi:NAD(P)-dependent dehydrogenase (short-subunit alcohol dehydrogenase family)
MGSQLSGKTAIVTGGGRGLGREVALAMASEGAAVVVNDLYVDEHDRYAADAVVQEIEARGGRGAANHDSVCSPNGAAQMVAQAVDTFGTVDVLANFAGNIVRAGLTELTLESWSSVLDVHLLGHFLCSQAVARQMILQQSGGSIVMVSSRSAFMRPSLAYSAAKGGIMGLASSLALELAEHGIRVNCLLPGAVTQLFPSDIPRAGGGIPPANSLDAADVAPVVVYLATDDAKHLTHQYIYASGGDLCVYPPPFDATYGGAFVRKIGRWTVDELHDVLGAVVPEARR